MLKKIYKIKKKIKKMQKKLNLKSHISHMKKQKYKQNWFFFVFLYTFTFVCLEFNITKQICNITLITNIRFVIKDFVNRKMFIRISISNYLE